MQISIRQLSKRYRGNVYALRDVDLEIGSGMFGLLGPNGAGKTTLMRILVTLLEPSSGEVRIDDLDLRRDRARIRRQIGYLPQELDRLKERYPVISTVPDAGGYDVRLVADLPPDPTAEPLAPNLEDAYIHFMQSVDQEMDLKATYED